MSYQKFEDIINKINKEEFINYFHELHHRKEIKEKFNLTDHNLNKILLEYNLFYTDDDKKELQKKLFSNFDYTERNRKTVETYLKKYGVVNNSQLVSNKEKIKNTYKNKTSEEKAQINVKRKATKLDKYNDENYNNRNKAKETCLNRYGIDNPFKDINKIKNSYIDKYNVSHPMKTDSVKEKVDKTMFEKYGCKRYSQTAEFKKYIHENKDVIKEKSITTYIQKYGSLEKYNNIKLEHYKETCKDKYGVEFAVQNKEVQNKRLTTLRNKDIDYWSSVNNKRKMTEKNRREENSYYNLDGYDSRYEYDYYGYLLSLYDEDDIIYKYRDIRYSVNNYQFECDFYIKSEDKFIELNIFPTHYIEPFNENNVEHLKLLLQCSICPNNWMDSQLIVVWAGTDVIKRQVAIKNNLIYEVVYK